MAEAWILILTLTSGTGGVYIHQVEQRYSERHECEAVVKDLKQQRSWRDLRGYCIQSGRR